MTKTAISLFVRNCKDVIPKRDTYEEAMANIKDAIKLHVEDLIKSKENLPKFDSISFSTVLKMPTLTKAS